MAEQKKSVIDYGGEVTEKMQDAMDGIRAARTGLMKMSFEFNDAPNEMTALYDTIDDMLRAADSLIERSRVNLSSAVAYQQKRPVRGSRN